MAASSRLFLFCGKIQVQSIRTTDKPQEGDLMEYTAGRGTTALGIIGTVLGGTALAGNTGLLGNVLGTNAANAAQIGRAHV